MEEAQPPQTDTTQVAESAGPPPPPCEPIADTGGINLIPLPRTYNLRGSPFHIPNVGYFYIATRVTNNVRKRWVVLSERLAALGIRVQLPGAAELAPNQAIFTDSARFPKWMHLESHLRGDAARPGGYRIIVNQDGVILFGADESGVLNACETFVQLIEDGPYISGVEIDDYPLIPYRALHLDLKGWPPTPEYLQLVIQRLASVKINALILEYETHFAYPSAPGVSSPNALTTEQILELDSFAFECGVTLIPLISCVGNLEYVLNLPEYAGLREHAGCPRELNVGNPEAVNLLLAMIGDLHGAHTQKFMHIGGDGAILMGHSEMTLKRAEELGGVDAVYLEHIGALARYLEAENIQPMFWDETVRVLSDEQIKWLPPSAIIVHASPAPVTKSDVAAHAALFQRYKGLARAAWGSATISPTAGDEAYDTLDVWSKFIESNLLSGFVATVRTRACSQGGVLPPLESVWPYVYYAADRAWRGVHSAPREQFPQRFVTRFFGARDLDRQSRIWAGLAAMNGNEPWKACEFLSYEMEFIVRNDDSALFLEGWSAVQAVLRLVQDLELQMRDNFFNIQNGTAEPFETGQMRWRLEELKAKTPEVINRFGQYAAAFSSEAPLHEYIESALAYCMRRIDELDPLLSSYELPAEDLREPLPI